jgi:hypothetical protein
MDAVLASVRQVYAAILPPARAAYYGAALDAERGRLLATGRVDYRGLSQVVTLVNREQGLMARPELADLELVRLHELDPVAQPRDVPALLGERRERRDLAAVFRSAAARLLSAAKGPGAASREVATPAGPLTLLADLGRPAGPPRTFQLIRASLNDLADETIAAHDVYYTAGEFLAFEPAAPPGRWADSLPPEQRAYAPTNALSPRLGRAAILAPEHASRVLWPSLRDSRVVVDDLRGL